MFWLERLSKGDTPREAFDYVTDKAEVSNCAASCKTNVWQLTARDIEGFSRVTVLSGTEWAFSWLWRLGACCARRKNYTMTKIVETVAAREGIYMVSVAEFANCKGHVVGLYSTGTTLAYFDANFGFVSCSVDDLGDFAEFVSGFWDSFGSAYDDLLGERDLYTYEPSSCCPSSGPRSQVMHV